MRPPALLVALAIAALVATKTARASSINDCGDTTWEDHTSGASPSASDCMNLAANIVGGGTWTFESGGTQFQIAQKDTCAFGVQTACMPQHCPKGGILVKIGNQDIIDLIHGAVDRFTWNSDKVGSAGLMNCSELGDDHPIPVLWGIYHNS
ncbi:putative necrosis-inducing factor-domain-containing protein [Lasiosphaeris hirsuta]|uniref:Necrosis-inducing factor-domain-containing protein n=1 Tax=Lasiosphaeris hirsuta TaxID=260670 RepID=A0AA40BAZ9_9PEZI|nr:putative necrosis-inducing factor-domain-containing protein [Lasiosphaeris hirsuta]